jgi:hypothetical protein
MHAQSSAGQPAGTSAAEMVLERPLNPEFASLEPNGSDARRVVLTGRGCNLLARWQAELRLFGRELGAFLGRWLRDYADTKRASGTRRSSAT